ncbi:MAG TPA: hypothetical protein VHG08_00590 [Longimicrobium sp.]|nr:hypothetical protein [Longimicrobium sp.]
MSRGPIFIKQEVFEEHLRHLPTRTGGEFADMNTIYADMSRLVVAWLATTPRKELVRMYQEYGWGGSPAARAIQDAAKDWLRKYHPDLLAAQRLEDQE